jgi:hypothetical protein
MSLFDTPISRLKTQDLQELLADQAVENVRLEFKREVPNKEEMLKKLSSFANTFGGILVVGAEANSTDGRIVGLPGVEQQQSYKQTIIQWCSSGTMPPVTAEVSDPVPIPDGNGRVCYVINVPESDLGPHFLNGRKGVYVRTDEFSKRFEPGLATEQELRHLLNRRTLVQERRKALIQRARERYATFVARPQPAATDDRQSLSSRIELAVTPRFPATPLCAHERLFTTVRENSVSWRQVGFPRYSHSAMTHHESAIVLQPCGHLSYFEATLWGTLYYAAPIAERRKEYDGIHTNGFIGRVLVFLRHAQDTLARLGYTGPLHIELVLTDIRDVPWIAFPDGFAQTGTSCELDTAVAFTLDTNTDDLEQRQDFLASKLLRLVFFAMNWPDIADSPGKLDAIIATGYEYNFWAH